MKYRGLIVNGSPVKTWRDRWEEQGGFRNIPNRGFFAKKTGGDTAEMLIYEQIGVSWWDDSGVGAKQFADDLKALGDIKTLNIRINSPGGDVTEGDAIYSALTQHPATINVFIDGIAASAASFIAMAGDTIAIAEHAKLMIHNAWGFSVGNADDMRKMADTLDVFDKGIRGIYAARTGNSDLQLQDWMKAETWMLGPEAKDRGFADTVIPSKEKPEDSADTGVMDLMKMRLALARA